ESGKREGLDPSAVEATCFPWGRGRAWESFSKNELVRILSLGHFSRSELVRSFVRGASPGEVFSHCLSSVPAPACGWRSAVIAEDALVRVSQVVESVGNPPLDINRKLQYKYLDLKYGLGAG